MSETKERRKTGEYHGRLAFDPDTGFHIDEDGHEVVTDDGGKTWRYAKDNDQSHFEQYHERFATVDGTAVELMRLQLEHGREKAEQIMRKEHPHHYAPTEDDPHFNLGATNGDGVITHTQVTSVPDKKSATLTGHTDATEWEHGNAR